MQYFYGTSFLVDASDAVKEASRNLDLGDKKPSLILYFHSTKQDGFTLAKKIKEEFQNSLSAGCSTAGELMGDKMQSGSLVLMAFCGDEIRCAVHLVEKLSKFNSEKAREVSNSLYNQIGILEEDVNPKRQFAVTFVNGFMMNEEFFATMMTDAFQGIEVVGGKCRRRFKFKTSLVGCQR